VNDIFGIKHLAERLIPKYMFFATLDRTKVAESLKRQGKTAQELSEINRALDARSKSLSESLQYLRSFGVKNTRRLLSPLDEINSAMAHAVRKWAGTFPAGPQLQRQ